MKKRNFLLFQLVILILFAVYYICGAKDYCEKISNDFSQSKEALKKPLNHYKKGNIDLAAAEILFYKYKLNDLYGMLKDYPGDNIGLKVILAKLLIYKDEYKEAIDKLDEVLKGYPAHPEALYLKENVQK
ncbi:hypothetical protein KKB18_04035, partial [bacterium]|nr:hypothetical protein [bacterium]